MAELARMKNTHPVDLMIDMALERDMKFFMIQPIANEKPDRGAGADEASALGGDLLRLRCARLADHGQLAADASVEPLGAREAGFFTLEEAVR
jgi:hypothetical protein